jgi:hypothetical protein
MCCIQNVSGGELKMGYRYHSCVGRVDVVGTHVSYMNCECYYGVIWNTG